MTNVPSSQKYLWAAHAGAVVLVAAFAVYAFDAPSFFKGMPIGMLLALVFILFRSRLRDEYVERLWNAGTAAAFLAALITTMGVELVRGFANPDADLFSVPPLFSPLAVGGWTLGAFFVAFHWSMWRSRA